METVRMGRRVAGLMMLALLLARGSAAQVPALETPLQAFLDQVGTAILQVLRDDGGAGSAALTAARTTLAQLESAVQDPNARAALGDDAKRVARGIATLGRSLGKAESAVGDPVRSAKRKLKALKTLYARGLKVGSRLGHPVIAEVNARSAGFHRPGDQVTFRVLTADGSPCGETPTVTVENQYSSSAVDLATVATHADGTITMTMGDGAGGARVTVTACGRSTTRLLFNYGPRSVNGLPPGFPPNLPHGTYVLSYSASGEVNIPETTVGTIPNVNIRLFAQALELAFDQVAAAYTAPGCVQDVRYSRFDGGAFSVTFTVTCTSGEARATQTIRFTIRRAG
jgi:hypothetical protein